MKVNISDAEWKIMELLWEDAVMKETEEFLDKVYHGKMGLMLNAMVQQNALSQEDLEELYAILEKERNVE